MKQRGESRRAKVESRSKTAWGIALFAFVALISPGRCDDFGALCADRTAIERVYFQHRLGTKQSFEQASPAELIARLVREDLHKEAVLKKSYGVDITPAMVEAEVRRIDATTRAPEVLAELKQALGCDPIRFARIMARPIVVERTLRARFENDDVLHAPQRALAERIRTRLLAAKDVAAAAVLKESKAGQVAETTWQLAPRSQTDVAAVPAGPPVPTKVSAQSGAYAIEATAQVAQVLTPPAADRDRKFYFEDLDPELQSVLRAQLQKPGDVSAVIETPRGFLLFLAREKSIAALSVTSLSIPKRSYEEWLAQQPEDKT
jgi:hypothetical protein